VPARGAERPGMRIASQRPHRLRAAGAALCLRRGDVDEAVRRSPVPRLSRGRDARRSRAGAPRRYRRDAAAAAGGRPLPEGTCAGGVQPRRIARGSDDAGHLAPHDGADGRQRAGGDDAAQDRARRRHPRSHQCRRPPARRRSSQPHAGAGLAPRLPARTRFPAAGR
ncbi:hypothetical protein LTR94_032097, partial [Friedmanniomyces endolithicus]